MIVGPTAFIENTLIADPETCRPFALTKAERAFLRHAFALAPDEMREQLRPNAYLRLIENRWVTTESSFVDLTWWDACTDPDTSPQLGDRELPVWVGIDASTKRDSTAIVACAYDRDLNKVRLVWHRVFQPTPDEPLDFEQTIEERILWLARVFDVREVRYDPYQMVATAQRLIAQELPMVEFNQTVGNLTAASSNLYELVKGRNLIVYDDPELRLAVQRAVAIETSRGWRVAKDKATHKIDVVVALAQAALGAVEDAAEPAPMVISPEAMAMARSPMRHGHRYGRSLPTSGTYGVPYSISMSDMVGQR